MKFITFITYGLLLCLSFLPQSVQADISQADARRALDAVKRLMREQGVETTFRIINTHFPDNSVSPDSRDQPPSVIADMTEALGNTDAQLFCVSNNNLVASSEYPTLANGQFNVLNIKDANGKQPFVQMIKALKDDNEAVISVTNVFPQIAVPEKKRSLTTKHSFLVISRRALVGEEEIERNPEGKFFCGVSNVRSN